MTNENDTEIKLLCMMSYIGPLFVVGRVVKNRYNSDLLEFHSWQGGMLFFLMFFLYSFTGKIFGIFSFLPIIREIFSILFYTGVFTMGIVLTVMGIVNAFHGIMESLPIIGYIERSIKIHYIKL